ncbi:MAG: aminotransferase class V-fold PLP-dependent enzyme [Planctomycetota bacterium]
MPSIPRLYFDNAATSFPKPPSVVAAMTDYAAHLGASPGRGGYREARAAADLLMRCRARICELIRGESPRHVIFTLNTTDALNLAIRGIVEPSRRRGAVHLVTTAMDHNSVLRPFNALVDRLGVEQTVVHADPHTGLVDPDAVRRAIRPDTRLVAAVHASNVTGTLQPIGEVGRVCRELAVPFLVDAAQTLGHIPVDVQELCIDLLAAPGHKGLLGPLGTGFLYMRPGMEKLIDTIREGGTGSRSEYDRQPDDLPDKYEPGSHNTIGIAGLLAGVDYLLERGVGAIADHELSLTTEFLRGLHTGSGELLPGLRLLGPPGIRDRVGVFSVTVDGLAPAELADVLEQDYGILTRPGLHCAPAAHETMQTDPASTGSPELAGSTRFSLGPFLTVQDVKYATDALASVCEQTIGTPAAR